MSPRERLKTIFEFGEPDRIGYADAFWPETIQAWRTQGMPDEASPLDLFGVEWRVLSLDTSFRLPEVVIEDTGEHRIVRNSEGMTARFLKGHSTTPGILAQLIHTRQDWQEHKPRLIPDRCRLSPTVLYAFNEWYQPPPGNWDDIRAAYEALRHGDKFLLLYVYDAWENLWRKIGFEPALIALHDDPDWVADISTTHTRLVEQTVQLLWDEGIRLDGVFLIGDFASAGGMLFSREMYRSLFFPHHCELCGFFRSLGLPVMFHCCGRITPVISDLVEAGVRALQPLSCRSGLDLREIQEAFGDRLVLVGNVSVAALAKGGRRLEEEVREKILQGKRRGRYIYFSDHSIPPTVSYRDYQRVVEIVRELGRY